LAKKDGYMSCTPEIKKKDIVEGEEDCDKEDCVNGGCGICDCFISTVLE